MSGKRCLETHLSRFPVPNFANHDDVGVSAQEGTQRGSEGQSCFDIDLDLPQVRVGDLDGVLCRPDLPVGGIQLLKNRMKRGGLARSRRPDTQDQAVRTLDQPRQHGTVIVTEVEISQRFRARRGQQAHDHVFRTVVGGDGRDAQLQGQPGHVLAEIDLPVLRSSAVGDVQVRHHLDAADHGTAQAVRQFKMGFELAILSQPDPDLALARVGLDVNIGSPMKIGLDDDVIDQADQRVVVRGNVGLGDVAGRRGDCFQRLDKIAGRSQILRPSFSELIGQTAIPSLLTRKTELRVDAINQGIVDMLLGEDRNHLSSQRKAQILLGGKTQGIVRRDHQTGTNAHERHHAVFDGGLYRQQHEGGHIDREVHSVHQRNAHLGCQGHPQLLVRDEALIHQNFA